MMDENMIVIVCILFTMCILKDRYTHASCGHDSNGLVKFWSTCKYMCHCKDITEQCVDEDGACISGCANAWMGPGCQYRGVAFGEFANHKNNMNPNRFSERAIDGDLVTCSRTSNFTHYPWWRSWLPRKELITGLVLITDAEKIDNFKKLKVTVEDVAKRSYKTDTTSQQTCYTQSNTTPPSNTIEVTCDEPLLNNQVRITLESNYTQLVICDIRVYGGKNLAFGRQANQSTYNGPSHNAGLTVDGVIGTSLDECSATKVQNHPWWSVDLKHIMRIQYLRISTDRPEGLSNFLLHAKNYSSDEWVTIHNETDKTPPTRNITVLIQARFLRLNSTKQNVNLTICEVQVFGECTAGRWGPGCDFICGHCLGGIPCSGQTGHCPKGCEDGFKDLPTCETACSKGSYGMNCEKNCSENCQDKNNCNTTSGKCDCKPGWKAELCDQDCVPGTFGDNCSQNCSDHCKGGYGHCNKVNGTCDQLCEAGWKEVLCDQECVPGTFGDNCSQNCSHHCKGGYGNCNKVNGTCDQLCEAGWKEVLCDQECVPGTFGDNCSQNCSDHCKGGYGNCNKVNGTCDQLCEAGWKEVLCDQECVPGTFGDNCSQNCSDHCKGGYGNCNKVNGTCDQLCEAGWKEVLCDQECVPGTFGDNCSQNCSDHCKGGYGNCNKVNGTCDQLCEAGWKEVLCDQGCENGKFGENCLLLCGHCLHDPCERVSGNCTGGCMAGYKDTTRCVDVSELSASPDSPVTAIVGGVVVAIVVIVAVLLVLLFLRYRRNNRNQKPSTIFSGDLTDASRDVSDTDIDAVEPARSKPSTSKRENIYMNSDVFLSLRNTYDTDNNKPGTSIIKSGLQSDVAVADNGNDSEYYNTSVQRDIPKGAIRLSNLREYIGGNTAQDDIFHEQFISLPKALMHPTTVALKPRNRPKNRYKKLYAYDHSRVVLQQIPGKPDSDYINAAFINGHSMEKAYIAAQGPTKVNILDFWRMIWEKDVTKIVMVTNVVEEGKDKCEQYWNSDKPNFYDSLSVTVTSEEVMAEFTIRTFSVKSIPQNKLRTITHYQFTAWPDKSIPNGHTGLVQFWSKVRMDDKESAHPWLVHCSAGVGRTGTFIALDILYEQGRQLEYVNVNQCVRELRQQRVNMVQTQIVYEALVLPSLQIRLSDFENEYRKLIEIDKQTGMTCLMSQFEMQEEVVYLSKKDIDEKEHSDDVDLYTTAKLPENKVKNRYNNILASDKYRHFLSTHVPGCNDYINAVYIPSYRKLRGFIVSQAPLENTAIDCCRLVHERDIHVIVTFADNGTEKIGTYLPDKGSLTTGHFHLELVSEEKRRNYTIRNYSMQFKKKEQKVKQLVFTQWLREETVPRDHEAILSLVQEVTELQRQSDNSPILVQCLNGAERSGMFVVLMNVLERMRLEQEVAIPPVIRNLRQIRQQFIPNFEQYKFCHEAVLRHIQDTSTYANV